MASLAQRFALVVREQRRARGLAQATFAEILGCDPSYVSMLERAERNPSLVTIERVAGAFGLPAWRLLKLAEESR